MKAYGDKKTAGYGTVTGKPGCRCCNGSYAKVGRASNKDNALRSLKKSARQLSKERIEEGIDDNMDHEDLISAHYQSGSEIIADYNLGIIYPFIDTLKKIAPELSWADSDSSWDDMFDPRGLKALPWKLKKWAPHTNKEWEELIVKASHKWRYHD